MLRFFLELASKNLRRNQKRTCLTIAAIATGIFIYIVTDALLLGIDQDNAKSIIEFETGNIQVIAVSPEEKQMPNLKYLVPDGNLIAEKVKNLPDVKGVTQRLLFGAFVINGIDEVPVIGVGVDPNRDTDVFKIKEYVRKGGQWLEPNKTDVIIGKKIADRLQVKVGDLITIRTQTKNKSFQVLDLKITGVLASPDPNNNKQIYLPLDICQKALGVGTSVSLVAVKTNLMNDNILITRLKEMISEDSSLKVKTWDEFVASFLQATKLRRAFGGVFLFLIAILSVIGIINSILLSSLERVREIGILKAMGMTERDILNLFSYEALGLGVLGGISGVAMGIFVNCYMIYVGLDIQSVYGNIDIGYALSKMHSAWNWEVIIWSFIFGVILSFGAGYLPARKAARLNPIESLRQF